MLLYQVHDAGRMWLDGVNAATEIARRGLTQPMAAVSDYCLPGMPHPAKLLDAGLEMVSRTTQHYAKPQFSIAETAVAGPEGIQIVPVEERVALAKPFCNLIHFQRKAEVDHPKVLLVAPLSGHHATLLRGTVKALLPEHDVYITDWLDARDVPLSAGDFGLDDYTDTIVDCIRHLGPRTHVIAVCQPTVPVLAACSIMAEDRDPLRPLSMTLMGGPIDVAAAETEVTQFARAKSLGWFRHNMIATVPFRFDGRGRRVYPGFLQLSAFVAMNPDRHLAAHIGLLSDRLRDSHETADKTAAFYDEYLAVLDMPETFYLETVERVFHEREIATGRYFHHGRKVDPGAIEDIALLTVEGEKDDISAPGQTIAAHRLCRNLPDGLQADHCQPGVGHYGVFNGKGFRTGILPKIRSFIAEHEARAGQLRRVA